MTRTRTVLRLVFLALVLIGVASTPIAGRYARATGFVLRAAGLHGTWQDRIARFQNTTVRTSDATIDARVGRVRARIYRPAIVRGRTLLVTGGVHAQGIDEPRLKKLARDLAVGGTPVVTAEVPDLLQYRITPNLTDTIEDAAAWVAAQPALAPDGKIGLFGVSFAGGLSIAAAGRPSIRDHIALVLSFGGHGDIDRVMRYLSTGIHPNGATRPPHDYGVVVILMNVADRVVPPEQVAPLRTAVTAFMNASHLDMVDKAAAQREFTHARELQVTLPEPSRTLMGYVNDRNVKGLGAAVLPHLTGYANDAALSPDVAPGVRAPVFLIHGADDNVVPAIESRLLADRLRGQVPVHLLITPLITHAEVDRPSSAKDIWRLISFWYAVLNT